MLPGAGLFSTLVTKGIEAVTLTMVENFVVSSVVGTIAGTDYRSCSFNVVWNSDCPGGGSGGGSGGGGNIIVSEATNYKDGKILSCSTGNKLCGTTSCIPSGAVCCQNVGLSGYCPSGNVCTKAGTCETANSANAQICSDLSGTKCVSPANSCNQTNSSTYKCDGSCTVYTPPDSGCATPDITLTVPSFTAYGKECVITSKVKNASSCSINGANVSLPNGTYTSAPLTATTDFTMVCKNGSVVTAQKTVTCRLTPSFQEI